MFINGLKIVKTLTAIDKVVQEERTMYWQVIVLAIVRRKKNFLDICSFLWMFAEVELFECTAIKRYEW
jgi:hypothetical protein